MPKARPQHFATDPLATSADATELTAHCCTKAMDAKSFEYSNMMS